MWKSLGISGILFFVATGSALAQNCHAGVQIGLSIASASISVPAAPATLDGLGARSKTPDMGLHAVCDMKIPNSPFVAGVFFDHTWKQTDFTLSAFGSSFSAGLGNSYTFGGRAGYLLTNGSMPYVLLGHTTSTVDYSIPAAGLPTRMSGLTYGGGIQIPLAPSVRLALETRYTKFAETDLVPGFATIKADQISGIVRLNFELWK